MADSEGSKKEQQNQQGQNMMPKEELAASGSGHLLLEDFDEDENEEGEQPVDVQGNGLFFGSK